MGRAGLGFWTDNGRDALIGGLDRRAYLKCFWSRILHRSCWELAGLATSGSFFSRDFGRIELSLGAGMAWQPVFLRKEIKYFGSSSIKKWTCSCASCWLLPALSPSLVLTAEVKYSSHKIARDGEKNMTPDLVTFSANFYLNSCVKICIL